MRFISAFVLMIACLAIAYSDSNSDSSDAPTYDINDLDNHWKNFKKNHNKSYQNSTHENQKKKIFLSHLHTINSNNDKFNNGQVSYTMDVNEHTDKSPEEFIEWVNKGLIVPNQETNNQTTRKRASVSLPSSIDWRTSGVVNTIQNQGQCGSCWAFSAVASLESAYAITNGKLPKLSEQNLVDCSSSYGNNGCNGGWYYWAWNYIKATGIDSETSYPYTSAGGNSGKCKYSTSGAYKTLYSGYTGVQSGSETALAQAIAKQPVSVAIYVTNNFQLYSKGVFTDTTCSGKGVNHAVVLVGYGSNYYILRNSWGTTWGMSGYMNFARNQNNMCQIASYAYYPNVARSG